MTRLHLVHVFDNDPAFRLSDSPRYDFNNSAFRESAENFREEVFGRMFLPRDEIIKLAEISIQLELDILIQPRSRALTLLFKNDAAIHRDDAVTIIRGFGERRAFVERLVTLLKNTDEETLEKDELERMCDKAESAVFREAPVSSFLTEIHLYFDFENAITGDEQSLVPSEVLLDMLRSRRLTQMLNDLQSEADDKDYWTLTEIENALERHLLVGGLEQVAGAGEVPGLGGHSLDFGGFHLAATKRKPRRKRPEVDNLQFSFLDDDLELDQTPTTSEKSHDEFLDVLSHGSSNGGEKRKQNQTAADAAEDEPDEKPNVGDLAQDDLDWLEVRVFNNNRHECHEFVARVIQMDDWLLAKATIDKEIADRGFRLNGEEAGRLEEVLFGNFFRGKRWSQE